MRGWLRPALAALALAPLLAGTARAHSLGTARFEAPVGLPVVLAVGGLAVAGSAALVSVREGRPAAGPPAELARLPARPVALGRSTVRLAALATVVAAVGLGLVGRPAGVNPALPVVWAVGLHGVAIVAIVAGDPWPALSPWRTVYAGLCRLEGDVLALRPYPERLGTWPALVGFLLGVGVVGTLTVVPRSPRLTAVALTLYAATMLAGAITFGPAWLDRADPLAVFYGLLGRIAPFELRADGADRVLVSRRPWRRGPALAGQATVAFAVAAAYTVAFDGLTATRAFADATVAADDLLGPGGAAGVVVYLVGLLVALATFRLAAWLTARASGDRPLVPGDGGATTRRALAPALLPVAAALELAHGYPLVLDAAGGLVGAGDPLGWVPLPALWASLVAIVAGGHVVAVVATARVVGPGAGRETAADGDGHGPGLAGGERGSPALEEPVTDGFDADVVRARLPVTALLVASAVLSLWIVSRPLLV